MTVDATYMAQRKRYARPQAILFSDNAGAVSEGMFVPEGTEMSWSIGVDFEYDFMVLTDNNRKEIGVGNERIEQRKRMINGRTRSIHVADKMKLDLSWDMIPSRAFANAAAAQAFYQEDADRGEEDYSSVAAADRYTTDGGAGGADMLRWYRDHPGTFWVFLAYDNFHNFSTAPDGAWDKLARYNERVEMYFSDFKWDIIKRGQRFDFWNVSMSLEEA